MSKPKRYPRARSPLHARFLNNQRVPVRKPFHNDWIGPGTPGGLVSLFRKRYSFDDDMTAKVFDSLLRAANGQAIKWGQRISMLPAGHGLVLVHIAPR
jgi:hypothetical protein